MKKVFLYIALSSVLAVSCRKDEEVTQQAEVSVDTQNSYDDEAILKYLDTHSFDQKGNLKEYVSTDTANVKLSDLSPVKLPSGVTYIVRNNAQPVPGTDIGSNDILHLMTVGTSYVGAKVDDKVSFASAYPLVNTVSGTGSLVIDPAYYYVKNTVLAAYNKKYGTTFDHSYYEIEGLREAIQKFKAFNLPAEANYNMQGIIIVPSRAAFARDPHYNYTGTSLRNRSFIFTFQVYKSEARPANMD